MHNTRGGTIKELPPGDDGAVVELCREIQGLIFCLVVLDYSFFTWIVYWARNDGY